MLRCPYYEEFVPPHPEKNENEARDDLSVILGFCQMLADSSDPDRASSFAAEHGWLDADGQPTPAGSQLARALLQQSGTRTVFRLW